MKILIAEDDFTSRLLLQELLNQFGTVHIAINGKEAVEAVNLAMDTAEPYDLICLDIMMPEMDGQEALKQIRKKEEGMGIRSTEGVKIIMVTALGDPKNVFTSYMGLCDAYLTKPILKEKLYQELRNFGLIQ